MLGVWLGRRCGAVLLLGAECAWCEVFGVL